MAKLRNVQILSFADLQTHILSALELVNEAPLTGKNESRWSSYLAEEKDYMLPLPIPFLLWCAKPQRKAWHPKARTGQWSDTFIDLLTNLPAAQEYFGEGD